MSNIITPKRLSKTVLLIGSVVFLFGIVRIINPVSEQLISDINAIMIGAAVFGFGWFYRIEIEKHERMIDNLNRK